MPARIPHYRIFSRLQHGRGAQWRSFHLYMYVFDGILCSLWGVWTNIPLVPGLFETYKRVYSQKHHLTPANWSIDFLITVTGKGWSMSFDLQGRPMDASLGSRQPTGSVVTAWLDADSQEVSHWLVLKRPRKQDRLQHTKNARIPKRPQEVQKTNDTVLRAEAVNQFSSW